MNKRIFIAADLAKETKKNIRMQSFAWLNSLKKARITPEENLHLTLRFLGNISDQQIWDSVKALENIAKEIQPFYIKGRGLVAFPTFEKGKILGYEIEGDKELTLLSNKIKEEFDYLNIGQKENRKYVPHITLARLKKSEDLNFLRQKRIDFSSQINAFQLMDSDLKGSCPEYTLIQNFKL